MNSPDDYPCQHLVHSEANPYAVPTKLLIEDERGLFWEDYLKLHGIMARHEAAMLCARTEAGLLRACGQVLELMQLLALQHPDGATIN